MRLAISCLLLVTPLWPALAEPLPEPGIVLAVSEEPPVRERPDALPEALPEVDDPSFPVDFLARAGALGAEAVVTSLAEEPEVVPDIGGEEEVAEGLTPPVTVGATGFTEDLTDEELARRFLEDPASLGSLSIGLAEAGRVINAVQLTPGETLTVVDPAKAWATKETVEYLRKVAEEVAREVPGAVMRVSHLGTERGGWLRPHLSHQSGRDADVGFYYREGVDPGAPRAAREKLIDLKASWAFIRALALHTDVQFVLVDRRVQAVLYEYALGLGEDKVWLDRLFLGTDTMVRHARRHRDHFHVRFYAPRSQELGRRVLPLLARTPAENLRIHRVVRGDTLSRIAGRYGSTVRLIMGANGLSSTRLKVGRTLNVPVRGPCTSCPVPAPLVLPPRYLPPVPEPKS